jgi:hypothetical protein
MKARLHLLLLLLLVSIGAAASPDSLRRLELFIDHDPGLGNGTPYTIATQRDTFNGTGITMSVPANITPGWHILYVRSFADSSGYRGRWSHVAAQSFFVPVEIVAAEYFFDTDPGDGQAAALTVGTPDDTVSLSGTIATTGLMPDWHKVYVRSKNNLGIWSSTQARRFFVEESVTTGEYFIDTDPGAGNATAFSFSGSNDTVSKTLSIATSSSLAEGKHTLYVRTRSGGKWSLVQGRDFYVLPRINAAEYFFDNDPGAGSGNPLSIGTASDTVTGSYSISTASLEGGRHRLYVRTRSASGHWGLPQERSFCIREKIVAAEYFWDLDPGEGNGVPLSISAQSDTVQQSYTVKAPCLLPGTHYLYVRTKDEHGRWSMAQEDTVTFSSPSVTATASYPGPGPYGTPVKVRGSGGIPPYLYQVGVGTPVSDSIFLAPNNASVRFTAIDTCGYSGSTTISTPAAPIIISGNSGGTGSVMLDGYRHWVYVHDASGNIIGAVRDYGQMLGTVTIDFLKNNSGAVRSYPFNSVKYLDRNWHITSANAPAQEVGLQLFAVDSEYNALASADPAVTSKNALHVLKYDGTNEDLSVTNNAGTYTAIVPDSVITFAGQTSAGDGYALAFSITSFSEFYESRNTAVALPLQSVELKATKQGKAILLSWHTEVEKATQRHQLLRGANTADMQPLHEELAKAGVSNDYSYLDEHPLEGINYYRVMVEGIGGERYYSEMAVVRMDANRILSISPNPARGDLRVYGLETGDAVSLSDLAGHVLWQGKASGAEMNLATGSFASGLYLLCVDGADGSRSVLRVEILR